MLRKIILLITGLFAITASSNVISAGNYVQASVVGGVIIVNQSNGHIEYCSGLINGITYAPFGSCKVIGSISTASLAGNVQINAGTAANDVVFVTNTATGVIVQCGLMVNGATGVPIGNCDTLQAQ